jgi:hypothetical protein
MPSLLKAKTAFLTPLVDYFTLLQLSDKFLTGCPFLNGGIETKTPIPWLLWFSPQLLLVLELHIHFWCATSAPAMLLNYYYLTIFPLITMTDGNQPWSCSLNSMSNSPNANGDDASHVLALKASVCAPALSYYSSLQSLFLVTRLHTSIWRKSLWNSGKWFSVDRHHIMMINDGQVSSVKTVIPLAAHLQIHEAFLQAEATESCKPGKNSPFNLFSQTREKK